MDIITWAITIMMDFIAAVGYLGIFLLMTLESMCLPVPSEVVMPFGGWLAFDGRLNAFGVVMAGTLGCTAGSVIAYYIGFYGGRPLVKRFGRYVLLREVHLDAAERWFNKYGDLAVFGSRLLPVIRTFISLPAGIAKMNFPRFVVFSFVGSLIWCFLLTYIGYYLGANWQTIEQYYLPIAILVLVSFSILVVWYFAFRKRKRNRKTDAQ